uniref:HK97-gp10 family putative phage morphogenesis protein n=1 Tax=Aerococcus urinaeequi TaxID=51665 RepID=UPI00352A1F46
MANFNIELKGDLELLAVFNKSNSQIRNATMRALKNNTEKTMQQAKKNAPVDTGFLKNNIVSRYEGMSGIVHSQSAYSGFQEFGTRYQSGTPFMRPALMFIYPQFRKDMLDVMRGVLK